MSLAQRLLDVMKEQSITEAALGKKAGVSQQAINKIVKGETQKPRHLISIATALNVDPVWLVSGVGPKQNITSSFIQEQPQKTLLSIYAIWRSSEPHIFHLDKSKIACKLVLPAHLNQQQGLYGFYSQSTEMEPRFKTGDLIIADNYQPPKTGEDCIIAYKTTIENIMPFSLLCFSHIKNNKITAFQYNLKKEFSFDIHHVTLHRILQIKEFLRHHI